MCYRCRGGRCVRKWGPDYQHTAIESVCDLFRGQETCRTEFTVTRDPFSAERRTSASASGESFLFQLPNPLLEELPLSFLLGQRQSFLIRGLPKKHQGCAGGIRKSRSAERPLHAVRLVYFELWLGSACA